MSSVKLNFFSQVGLSLINVVTLLIGLEWTKLVDVLIKRWKTSNKIEVLLGLALFFTFFGIVLIYLIVRFINADIDNSGGLPDVPSVPDEPEPVPLEI